MIKRHKVYDLVLDTTDNLALFHAQLLFDEETEEYFIKAEAAILNDIYGEARLLVVTSEYSAVITVPFWLEDYSGSMYYASDESEILYFPVSKVTYFKDKFHRQMLHKSRKKVSGKALKAAGENLSRKEDDDDDD